MITRALKFLESFYTLEGLEGLEGLGKTEEERTSIAAVRSSLIKTAATYSPTGVQYHRRGRA